MKMKFYNKGQSTVEYILLMAVVVSLAISIFGSNRFKQFMGKNSDFFVALKSYMEYTYRHGSPGSKDTSVVGKGGSHDLYINTKKGGGATHFFIPLAPYPK